VILVQALMIAFVAFLAFLGLRGSGSNRVSAGTKLAFCLLILVVVGAVISPGLVTEAAQVVGVGRGTDLVLYILALGFGFYVVSQYLAAQRSRNELHRLARRIAVVEAAERYNVGFADDASSVEHDPRS
jgi:hypothetical protein